jgi:hypothetical protein
MSRKNLPAEKPWKRPATVKEAREHVRRVFADTDWDADEQLRYLGTIDIFPERPHELTDDEVRAVIADFEKLRMINYAD